MPNIQVNRSENTDPDSYVLREHLHIWVIESRVFKHTSQEHVAL